MKINKQLFEDVLSGKLKGKFVLRNGSIISSDWLRRAQQNKAITAQSYQYILEDKYYYYYTENGWYISDYIYHKLDIIDFIPDTNMKENELTIEIPDGKIVDWDESKRQDKIVLKDKQLNYKDICIKLSERNFGHFYIDGLGDIEHSYTNPGLINAAPSKYQLKCILAKNQLATVAVYLNNGWKPSKGDHVFTIAHYGDFKDKLIISEHYFGTGENLALFQTQKYAKQAIEILGEETVKLALEPLGI